MSDLARVLGAPIPTVSREVNRLDAANRAQERLGREVNPVLVSAQRWQEGAEPFLQEVQRRPTLVLARLRQGATS